MQVMKLLLERAVKRLKRLEALNAPANIIDNERLHIERLKEALASDGKNK